MLVEGCQGDPLCQPLPCVVCLAAAARRLGTELGPIIWDVNNWVRWLAAAECQIIRATSVSRLADCPHLDKAHKKAQSSIKCRRSMRVRSLVFNSSDAWYLRHKHHPMLVHAVQGRAHWRGSKKGVVLEKAAYARCGGRQLIKHRGRKFSGHEWQLES